MKFKVFSVYDVKSESFGMPVFFAATGQAIRAFDDQCNKPGQVMHDHPADFVLNQLGEYDDTTGQLIPLKVQPLGTGADFVKTNNPDEE